MSPAHVALVINIKNVMVSNLSIKQTIEKVEMFQLEQAGHLFFCHTSARAILPACPLLT
ncbi:hypothetical protein RAVI111496_23070 [Rahnella victoriana]